MLRSLETSLLRETFKGRDELIPVVAHWQRLLANQIEEVSQEVERKHLVGLDPYSKGNPLFPDTADNRGLFIEREDLQKDITLKIQTSAVMPTFLLLGQRRTGKTSLLNFLPRMFDQSRHLLAVLDAQSMSGELSVSKWLGEWRKRVHSKLALSGEAVPLPDDWLAAWDAFSAEIHTLAEETNRKIILCMEEYEATGGFLEIISKQPKVAEYLLSRMRSFTQRQNMVILMFVGASGFDDLPGEPKWSKYFVNIHIFRIEYLSREGSLKRVTAPVPGFRLRYEAGLPERIWELTQGHPHLLHSICSELVSLANNVPKNPVGHEDLDLVLERSILQKEEQPFDVFWTEFCHTQSRRDAVLAIARRETVDDTLHDVRRLADYKYIIKTEEGWRMRVPLFEQWLLRFGY